MSPTLGADGTLAFVQGWPLPSQLVSIDRKGAIEPIGDLHRPLGQGVEPAMALSPDGHQLALSINNAGDQELWSYHLARGSMARLSVGATRVTSPIWTPDGRRVLFGAFGRGRSWDVYSVPSHESGEPAPVLPESAAYRWPCTISPDGRWLIYAAGTDRAADLWLAPKDKPEAAQPLMKTPFREDYAKFSPDGRSILYVSDESGRPEVYVRAFPIDAARVQVSTNWRLHGDVGSGWAGDLLSNPYGVDGCQRDQDSGGLRRLRAGAAFQSRSGAEVYESFAMASNGRFLFARPTGRVHVSVILNWTRRLTQLERVRR